MSQSESSTPEVGYIEGLDGQKSSPLGTEDSSADSSDKSVNDESTGSINSNTKDERSGSSSSESAEGDSSGDDGGSSSSSEGSFQTVKDTTVLVDPSENEDGDVVITLQKKEPADARSKSASPGKAVVKQGQGRASSSPILKTPPKKDVSPKTASKRTAAHSTSGGTPVKATNKQVENKSPRKSTGSTVSSIKTPPPSKTGGKRESVEVVKEAKNEVTPKTSRKGEKARGKATDSTNAIVRKSDNTKTRNKNKLEVPVRKDDSSIERKSKEKEKVKVVKRKRSEKMDDDEEMVEEEVIKVRKDKRSSGSAKYAKLTGTVKKSSNVSESESEAEKPGTSMRIPKVSAGRRYQRVAISRAKLCGLIKEGQIRILQITEALKVIDQTKFVVRPTTVCRNYYKCPGTGLPHIRRHLRNWQLKYGALIGKIAKLQLNMALAAERKKLELLDSDQCDDFKLVWQFESDVKHSEAAKPQVVFSDSVESTQPDPSPPTKKFKAEVVAGGKSSKKAKKSADTTDEDTPKTTKKNKKVKSVSKKEKKERKASDKDVKAKKAKKAKE